MKSCKDVAKLMSPGQKISLFDKMEIKLHFLICELCRVYAQQIKAVEKNFTNLLVKKSSVEDSDVKKLEQDVLEKIKENKE